MIVETYVDELGIWGVVVSPPCPWCPLEGQHAHLLDDTGPDPGNEVVTLWPRAS